MPQLGIAVRLGLLAGAFALLTACDSGEQQQAAQQQAAPPPPVSVVEVAEKPVSPSAVFVGRVRAVNKVDLLARVTGFLQNRAYTEGQEVKEGDLLFAIEQDTYLAQVDEAQAQLAKAKADSENADIQLQRAQDLIKNNNVSQATLDDRRSASLQAKAAVQQAQATLTEAQINLGYTQIIAPFAGRAGISNFSEGALIGPNSGTLTTLVSQDPIYVTFNVSQDLVNEVTERLQARGVDPSQSTVQVLFQDGSVYPEKGKIDFTDVSVDETTDTLLIRAVLPNPKRRLIDQQYVRVSVEAAEPEQALVIPQKAILNDQGGSYVFVVKQDNTVEQRRIVTGTQVESDVVVSSGLKQGEQIISDGLQRVRPGIKVDPAPEAPAAGTNSASPAAAAKQG